MTKHNIIVVGDRLEESVDTAEKDLKLLREILKRI
jgi:hypothetical protein